MERFCILSALLLASLLVTVGSSSHAPALSWSGEPQLASGQNNCFPGLVYHQRYNACLCMNATLFGSAVICRTNEAKIEQAFSCITSDWKKPNQVVGGVCPPIFLPIMLPSTNGRFRKRTWIPSPVSPWIAIKHCVENAQKITVWPSTATTSNVCRPESAKP